MIKSLETGKHVLVEKPISTNAEGHTLTTAEYARNYKISPRADPSRIREGWLQAELWDGVYWIKAPKAERSRNS